MIDARMLRRLWTSTRAGLRGVSGAPLVFVLSVVTMSAGLLLLGGYLLVVQNLRGVVARYGADLELVAFLPADEFPARERVAEIRTALEALDGVASVKYVSRERALARLRRDLGADAAILDGLAANPLPPSFEITPSAAERSPEGVRALARRLERVEPVEEVRYGEAWVESYAGILRALEWIGVGLGACLVLVLGVIVAGTVRLAVYTRSDEIQIQRLVGAASFFVRMPFYLEAALQGALGAGLALVLLYALFELGVPLAGETLEVLLGFAAPSFFGALEIALLVLLGIGLGVASAVVSLLRLEEAP